MIIDKLNNWDYYNFGLVGKQVFDFLQSLSPDSAEKKYELQGEDIFAQISSYKTRTQDSALLETHNKYIDIQAVLTGKEIIKTSSRDGLVVHTQYDEVKDVEFYRCSGELADINLYPGSFVLFYPHDAHMPGIVLGKEAEMVKKVVVKIKLELLTSIK